MTSENIVPLFKTFDELDRDQCVIYREHYDNWHAAYRRWDLIKAVLAEDDGAELAKLAADDSELALAKSEVARIKRERGSDKLVASTFACVELVTRLRQLCEKRDERLYGLSALAKRSVRFAMAHDRRNSGPAADSLPPAAS